MEKLCSNHFLVIHDHQECHSRKTKGTAQTRSTVERLDLSDLTASMLVKGKNALGKDILITGNSLLMEADDTKNPEPGI